MECKYLKNKIRRNMKSVEKIIERNESYVKYYQKIIDEGTATENTVQNKKDNEVFLERMREELVDLQTQLKGIIA